MFMTGYDIVLFHANSYAYAYAYVARENHWITEVVLVDPTDKHNTAMYIFFRGIF